MKKFIFFIFYLIVSCSDNKKIQDKPVKFRDTVAEKTVSVVDSSKLVRIKYGIEGSTYVDKGKYERFGKWFKSLNKNYILDPDIAHEIYLKKLSNNLNNYVYDVKAGPDFFIIYSHFIRLQNDVESKATSRKKIIRIFLRINQVYSNIDQDYMGNSYFSYQRSAIAAYAEFVIYTLIKYKITNKNYNIEKQKALYLRALQQKVLDELKELESNNHSWYKDLSGTEKTKYKVDNLKIIDELDNLITDHLNYM